MGRFVNLLKQFGADERGVFGVIFAMMAIVLIALSGAVIDFVTVEQTRNRAQVALDAAALALQKDIFLKPLNAAKIQSDAQALVEDRIGNSQIVATLNAPVIDVTKGSLYLSANIKVPTIFVALVGMKEINAKIVAEATRRRSALEVVMVLDNSGSMAGSRISSLKTAATCATTILFYGDVTGTCAKLGNPKVADNVSIGIVPFTVMVNVGTQYKDETWLDWAGKSDVAHINFDNDDNETTPFAGPVDRKALFANTGTAWTGCVEARKAPYDTTDDAATTSNPDTLFVPMFVPDENNAYGKSDLRPAVNGRYSYIPDAGGTCPIRTCEVIKKDGHTTYRMNDGGVVTTSTASCVRSDSVYMGKPPSTNNDTYSLLSRIELQSRICKYSGNDLKDSQTNADCPSVPVLPMTRDPVRVISKIGDMKAEGSTNIQQGTVWGMHALTNQAPMSEGRPDNAGEVNGENVKKALIIMTDGENDPPFDSSDPNGGSYFSWGFPYDGRLAQFTNQTNTENKIRTIQDAKTLAACDYAKNERHIEIYTIGLSSPSAVKAMLTTCATDAAHAHFPNQPTELIDAFKKIADELAPLTITQ